MAACLGVTNGSLVMLLLKTDAHISAHPLYLQKAAKLHCEAAVSAHAALISAPRSLISLLPWLSSPPDVQCTCVFSACLEAPHCSRQGTNLTRDAGLSFPLYARSCSLDL